MDAPSTHGNGATVAPPPHHQYRWLHQCRYRVHRLLTVYLRRDCALFLPSMSTVFSSSWSLSCFYFLSSIFFLLCCFFSSLSPLFLLSFSSLSPLFLLSFSSLSPLSS